MRTTGITSRVDRARTLDSSVGHGFAVAASDSLVVRHHVGDPQCLKTMIGGQA